MVNRITGVIGWVGTALVFGAVAIRFLRPEWMQYGTYMTYAGLVCILVYMIGQWRDIRSFYSHRQARYGTISIVSILVGLGIVIAVNYLGTRQSKRWDLTENQAYSLSEQSIKVLQGLDAPVNITVFDVQTAFDNYRSRLETYQYESNRVNVEYVDIDRNPARAKQAEVQQTGTILITYKDRTQRVTSSEEQDLTNALIKVVTGKEKKVYFSQGHGERDSAGTDRLGYSSVGAALGRDNFTVDKLVLAQQKDVPEDATVVIIAGPQTDFLPPEIDALKRYVAKGGKILAMIDPPEPSGADQANIRAFLHDWAIDFGNDIVVDASGVGQIFGGDASVPVAAIYPPHAITEGFRVMTAFPLARSVHAGRRRRRRPQRAADRADQSAELVGNRFEEPDDRPGRAQRRPGRQAGTGHARRGGDGAGDAKRRHHLPAATRVPMRQSPKRGSSRSATRISPPTTPSASRATRTSSSTPSTGWPSRRT